MNWLWWAPLAASAAHIVEEFVWPGGFPAWHRAYVREIRSRPTTALYILLNALLLLAGFAVALSGSAGGVLTLGNVSFRSVVPPPYAVPAWVALVSLLFSNAVFHLLGTLRTRHLSPGLRTALLLYVPLAVCGFVWFLATRRISPAAAILAALLGGGWHLFTSIHHALHVPPADSPPVESLNT